MRAIFLIGIVLTVAFGEKYDVAPKSLIPQGKMPVIGYGTWQAKGQDLETALDRALEAGYRHIDTATIYGNEDIIGKVLNRWITSGKLKREDLFITTKLPYYGMRPEGVLKYLDQSLKDLQLDYVDMYLIHVPFGFYDSSDSHHHSGLDRTTDHIQIWKAMENEVDAGRAKAIGLSNFNEKQIQKILDNSRIKPSNLQIELHTYNQQKPLVEFSKKNNIAVTAYSPLGAPGLGITIRDPVTNQAVPNILHHPTVHDIAKKHGVTEAQVVLRHAIQKGLIVIPKSTNAKRLKQNLDLFGFSLDDKDMELLNDLDLAEAGRLLYFDSPKEITSHPEYPFGKQ